MDKYIKWVILLAAIALNVAMLSPAIGFSITDFGANEARAEQGLAEAQFSLGGLAVGSEGITGDYATLKRVHLAQTAITRIGDTCPTGYRLSGNYCVPRN